MKKAQAAMEYLMTYGWAILIVIVVVAALYAMGVFTAEPSVSCSPCFTNFAYVDYADGTLVITNGARTIEAISVTASPDTGTVANISSTTASSGDRLTIQNLDTTGEIDITLAYTVTASGLSHTETGRIHN